MNVIINNLSSLLAIIIIMILITFLCILFYQKKLNQFSFYFFYLGIHLLYFYLVIVSKYKFTPLFTYMFYLCIFSTYQVYFVFTKRFILRTIIVIKGYLKDNELKKLVFWILLVFIPSLLNDLFILVCVFNPVCVLAASCGNFLLLSFLILVWLELVFLFIANKFNLCSEFLNKLLKYFSRRSCLHFFG